LTYRDGRPGDANGRGLWKWRKKLSAVVKRLSNTRTAGSSGRNAIGSSGFIETAIGSGMVDVPLTF
jgi:hypothetical protein